MTADHESQPGNSEGDSDDAELGHLQQTVADYGRELAELRETVRRLAGESVSIEVTSGRDERGTETWRGSTSRRSLLKGAGASLAALAAAGVATGAQAPRVEATDGSAIIAGQKNQTKGTFIYDQPAAGADALWIVDQNNGTITPPVLYGPLQGIGAAGLEGVDGYAPGPNGYGVFGASDQGYGVVGGSQTGIDVGCFGTGRFMMAAQSSSGAPATGAHGKGEMVVDSRGVPYVCQTAGSPGTWNAVGNLRTFPNPRRVYGNSSGVANTTYGPVSSQANSSGVPAGALSAYCAVQSYESGVMTLFPDGATDPGIANWSGTANGPLNLLYMLVPLSPAGNFKIHTYFNGSIYVDVWGYLL